MAKRLPKQIQEALDRLEPRLAAAIIAAFQNMTDAVAVQQVEAAIVSGNIEAAVNLLRISPEWFTPAHEALRAAVIEGGGIAAASIRIRDPFDGSRFVMGFDGRHVRAERWISEQSSRLITEILDDQRDMARTAIRAGLERGQHPRTVALDIVGRVNRATGQRDGGLLGLTSQQAQWAQNAEDQLRNLDRGYFTRARRDKRFDGTVRKAIDSGQPLSEADIRRISARYRDRLLKMRADTIARTETLNALRSGRHEGYAQLIDSGNIRQDQVRVRWQATLDGRVRDTHRGMHDQTIRFGETFTSPSGAVLAYPGDVTHGAPASEVIQCRCYADYTIRRDSLRYDDED